jgi:D-alanyl-lipoteichoic acid acyltransferase DltB (MBOAT superfamily)
MYIPLGGSSWRLANVWAIFTFVALWHDMEWRLLGWAWLMALAIAPEMLVKWVGGSAGRRRRALFALRCLPVGWPCCCRSSSRYYAAARA